MNENIEIFLEVLIIIASFAVFFYVNIKKPKTGKEKIRDTAIANNWVVTAEATKWDFRDHTNKDHITNDVWYVTYEYAIEGKKRKKRFVFNADGGRSFPHKIEVYYLKDNPKKVVFEGQIDHLTTYRLGCLWFILVLIVLNVLMALLLGKYAGLLERLQ